MCNFFSLITYGNKFYYFNWEQRQAMLRKELNIENADSHSEIAAYYQIDIDKANCYEYNPLTKQLIKDNIKTIDDYNSVLDWSKKLDIKTIVPLKIRKIIDPTKMCKQRIPLDEAVKLLKQWNSVWAYISSFFDINFAHDFTPAIQLWEAGYVPSFDGTTWRLHGYKGKVLWEGEV